MRRAPFGSLARNRAYPAARRPSCHGHRPYARPMIETWSPDWSNAVFTLQERDRRWARVRELMARDGIDIVACLPCTNSHDRGQADARYLTQLGENSDETTVGFPLEGEVAAWHSRGGIW